MEDKEVGELWAWYLNGKFPESLGQSILTHDFTKPLILNLISERARALKAEFHNNHWITMLPGGNHCSECGYPQSNFEEPHSWYFSDWQAQACKEFGVPVEEFRKAMEGG